jgi:hypothetical protein
MSTGIDQLFLTAYWPLVILQSLIRLYAIGYISRTESLSTPTPTTIFGPALSKHHWFQLVYRLRFLLALTLLIRFVFLLTLLFELTEFQGHIIELIVSGTVPFGTTGTPAAMQGPIGIAGMSVAIVVALVLPITAFVLDVCLGLTVRALFRRSVTLWLIATLIVCIVVVGLALSIESSMLGLGPQIINFLPQSTIVKWLATLFGLGEGDLGFALLNLSPIFHLWADIDYGIFIGPALLFYAVSQAILSNTILQRLYPRSLDTEYFPRS